MARLMAQRGGVFELSALAMSLTVSAAAQPLSDFSGRWIAVPEPAATGGDLRTGPLGSGWGNEVTMTQNATTLTVERAQFSAYDMQPPMRFSYALDGSENRITLNVRERRARHGGQDVASGRLARHHDQLPRQPAGRSPPGNGGNEAGALTRRPRLARRHDDADRPDGWHVVYVDNEV